MRCPWECMRRGVAPLEPSQKKYGRQGRPLTEGLIFAPHYHPYRHFGDAAVAGVNDSEPPGASEIMESILFVLTGGCTSFLNHHCRRYQVGRVDRGTMELSAIMQTGGCRPLNPRRRYQVGRDGSGSVDILSILNTGGGCTHRPPADDILWAGLIGVMWSYPQLCRQGAAAP